MIKQRTIQKVVKTSGVGLHNGEKVTMTLKPAEIDQGIIFRRVDQKKSHEVKVSPDAVKDTKMCSAIGENASRVATIEHLMSALSAAGIDNITIELNGSEVPIMDGSSIPFIYLLQTAQIKEQDAPKKSEINSECPAIANPNYKPYFCETFSHVIFSLIHNAFWYVFSDTVS